MASGAERIGKRFSGEKKKRSNVINHIPIMADHTAMHPLLESVKRDGPVFCPQLLLEKGKKTPRLGWRERRQRGARSSFENVLICEKGFVEMRVLVRSIQYIPSYLPRDVRAYLASLVDGIFNPYFTSKSWSGIYSFKLLKSYWRVCTCM